MNNAKVNAVLRKLGSKRVKQGLAAFRNYKRNRAAFERCFVARVYGPPGALEAARKGLHSTYSQVLYDACGIDGDEMWLLVDVFDAHPTDLRRLAKAFVEGQ